MSTPTPQPNDTASSSFQTNDSGAIQLIQPNEPKIPQCLLALEKESDRLDACRNRPNHWRSDAMEYYAGSRIKSGRSQTRCHITGKWLYRELVKTANIVPLFQNLHSMSEIIFGKESKSLDGPWNALLLSFQVKKWFDQYSLVIIPVDSSEPHPTRWKVEVISSDINNVPVEPWSLNSNMVGSDLHGRELKFHTRGRPASQFLYFYFITALIRMKNYGRKDWRDIWAKYYTQRPFPTPGNYMRKSILLALAAHFETTDIAMESWIADQGFETPLFLRNDQVKEVVRRVYAAVESRSDNGILQDSDEEDDGDIY